MQKYLYIIGILGLAFLPLCSGGQTKDPCHYSTEGTDFWFGIMENRKRGADHYLEITVTSRNGADFKLTYGTQETLIDSFSVAANSSETIRLDTLLLEPSGSERTDYKGIHLVATDSVNVYALNYKTKSSDVAVIYPTASLGKEYFAMCYTPNPTRTIESNSEFLIVATEDLTTINITPSVDTDKGRKAHITFPIILNKGQSYQVQSMNSSITGQGDLTGSYIQSDKPIAFYSGVKSTAVPFAGGTRDYLYEQIPPTNTWGREFYAVPLKLRTKDTYRILAAEDETTVTIEGLNLTRTLDRGEFYEFDLNSNQACRIMASKKVLFAQYCRSQEADGNNGVGDPFMIILSPVSQKVNDVTFEAYETDLVSDIFYANLTTLTSEIKNITLDGKDISSYFKPFPNKKFSYAQVPLSAGTHRLQNPNKKGGFLAYVYGFGDNNNTESYGYGVGFNLDIQLEIGGSFEAIDDTLLICSGDEIKLETGEYFVGYEWNTKETTPSILVSTEGMYSVIATTAEKCIKTDSLYVKVDKPEISLGRDSAVCLPGEYIIEAEPGFENYQWQDGSTGRTFEVFESGDFWINTTNKNGCRATDTVHVDVLMPKLAFKPDFPAVTINHPEITFTNQTEGALTYKWDFGDGTSSTEASPTHRYADIRKYRVLLEAKNNLGCIDTIGTDVEVIPLKFYAPNAFRPDSDIEKNRSFKPFLNATDPKNYQLKFFNRIGSEIFQSLNPDIGWDGTNAEQGVYVWIVKYLDIQGYEHQQKGTVMLIR
jgi:hypothetical protein